MNFRLTTEREREREREREECIIRFSVPKRNQISLLGEELEKPAACTRNQPLVAVFQRNPTLSLSWLSNLSSYLAISLVNYILHPFIRIIFDDNSRSIRTRICETCDVNLSRWVNFDSRLSHCTIHERRKQEKKETFHVPLAADTYVRIYRFFFLVSLKSINSRRIRTDLICRDHLTFSPFEALEGKSLSIAQNRIIRRNFFSSRSLFSLSSIVTFVENSRGLDCSRLHLQTE